jgi:hypothetical protein
VNVSVSIGMISRIGKLAASATSAIITLISAFISSKAATFTLPFIFITARGENTAYIPFFFVDPMIFKNRTFGFSFLI